MIRKPDNYDSVQVFEGMERLPVGGYVLKILKTKIETFDWGQKLAIMVDVAEGEHTGFYQKNFNAQQQNKKWKGAFRISIPKNDGSEDDEKAVRRLKSAMTAVEKSNDGYTWDWNENSLVGKLVGGLFGNKEWEIDGRRGWFTDCRTFCSVERIRDGEFTIPKDLPLKDKNTAATSSPFDVPEGFHAIKDSEIPF